jgi:hypothetical protein
MTVESMLIWVSVWGLVSCVLFALVFWEVWGRG